MPLKRGTSKTGRAFYKWGKHGKKYYYKAGSVKGRESAKEKAMKQGRAMKTRKAPKRRHRRRRAAK